ncbi:hypothetical protein UA08_03380 [Talaromyces atroroseus]|uniref:Nitrate reductase [NADPH] n=1 Tax=Talaromyces atroroseus TaxID=1441469 RepID=A0A225B5M5_TALAT|nr:hypothetical protein UA08_03380 [Talaromyces atroroseus]OKL61217.1 hypothetical protein UA08_03380 [Talaromyces atroroseus]
MSATKHPGASELEILNEPDWTKTHSHRVGLTHSGDEHSPERPDADTAKILELREKAEKGELITVRDIMTRQRDFHLERPEVHPNFWRYVLHTTESFIKYEQPWEINKKKKNGKEQKQERGDSSGDQDHKDETSNGKEKKEAQEEDSSEGPESGSNLRKSHEEHALIQFLESEQKLRSSMRKNDGKGLSPLHDEILPEQIDEADQLSRDSWVPRSDKLIRLTGSHPLNAEADLTTLFDAGLITPSPIHYVRNHGAVPHILWENHTLEVTVNEQLTLTMDDLRDEFESINIPIFIACDGSRRKELNMIKRTRAFNFTAAAAGCSYWRGVLLRDVLIKAGATEVLEKSPNKFFWVNYLGADELSQGKYETCIPLEYAMDATNDVLLAYQMNDHPIPPDHGYPLRLIVPGWVGARHYHIYDNRQLPSFVTDTESDLAQIMFRHPSTICNEQMLNSVVVRPAQGERIDLVDVKLGKKYRVQGYAYNGGGDEVDRVEISLDNGDNWLYCVRKFPDAPIRHGDKFWTWLHWYIDLDITKLIRAHSITVRAFDVHKNTQPPKPVWNIEGMMNNSWYQVRPEIFDDPENEESYLLFRHPVDSGNGMDGWMKPSTEEKIEEIKREASAPEKQFTRQEIEKHHTEDDCWVVINGKVYNATSVLSWHPGGKGPILAHAGQVNMNTTVEFQGIHDDFAQNKLKECILGKVTQKAMEHMKNVQKKEKELLSVKGDPNVSLSRHKCVFLRQIAGLVVIANWDVRWTQARLTQKKRLSEDTYRYTFSLPQPTKKLGLETGQHLQVGFHFADRLVVRPYTPVRPVVDCEDDGTFDLVVKTYHPDATQPGGTMGNVLDCLRENEEIEVKGPSGDIRYHGNGHLSVDDRQFTFRRFSLILGGSGVTPGYQVVVRILKDADDKTSIRVIDANKSESDILMRREFDELSRDHGDRFSIVHVLSHPSSSDWAGLKGHITPDILRKHAFEPSDENAVLLCGPPAMIEKVALPALKDWGYDEDQNLFGF